jgi:spore germination protein GerM
VEADYLWLESRGENFLPPKILELLKKKSSRQFQKASAGKRFLTTSTAKKAPLVGTPQPTNKEGESLPSTKRVNKNSLISNYYCPSFNLTIGSLYRI